MILAKAAIAASLLVSMVGLPAISASAAEVSYLNQDIVSVSQDDNSSDDQGESTKIGEKDRKAVERNRDLKKDLQKKIDLLNAKSDFKEALAAYQTALSAWQLANVSQSDALKVVNANYSNAEKNAKDVFNAAVSAANDAYKVASDAADKASNPVAKKAARVSRDSAIAAASKTRTDAIAYAKASRDAALTALGNAPIPPSKPVNDGKGKVKRNR